MNLEVRIKDFSFKNPIVLASGTIGFGIEASNLFDFKSVGAIITKTITLKPRPGNPPPRIYETSCGVLNSIGLENPGLRGFLEEKLPKLEKLRVPFIVSVGGFSSREYEEIIKVLDRIKSIKAIELNLSCPNIKVKKMVSQSPKLTFNLIKKLRHLTKKILIAKITPEVTDITRVAKAAEDAGSDGLSLVNTFFGMAVNIKTKKPYLKNIYGGYSGRAIKPLSLYRVWRVAEVVNIPIIGGGGIETAEDALEFLLAGASLISLGTINLSSPRQSGIILKGIKKYLQNNKIKNINQIKAGLKNEGSNNLC